MNAEKSKSRKSSEKRNDLINSLFKFSRVFPKSSKHDKLTSFVVGKTFEEKKLKEKVKIKQAFIKKKQAIELNTKNKMKNININS